LFVPCILDVVEMTNNMHWLYQSFILYTAPTCFGSSLPSSGSFLDPSELLEIEIERVVYHIMCGYVACVPKCRGSVRKATTTHRHTGHYTYLLVFNAYFDRGF
jgi:hypothetical protein